MSLQRTAASLEREVCHIHLLLTWPCCDHAPSDLPEAAPEGREVPCGHGEGCFPIRAIEVPSSGRSTANPVMLSSHLQTCIPFLSTAEKKTIACNTEHNKRRTDLFLLLYSLRFSTLWLVSTPALDKPTTARAGAALMFIDLCATSQEGLRMLLGRDSHPSWQRNDKTWEFPPYSQEVMNYSSS